MAKGNTTYTTFAFVVCLGLIVAQYFYTQELFRQEHRPQDPPSFFERVKDRVVDKYYKYFPPDEDQAEIQGINRRRSEG